MGLGMEYVNFFTMDPKNLFFGRRGVGGGRVE